MMLLQTGSQLTILNRERLKSLRSHDNWFRNNSGNIKYNEANHLNTILFIPTKSL